MADGDESGKAQRPVMIVTGGGRGIGAATARLAATKGWDVCVGFVSDRGAAERVAADISGEGARALLCQVDVADEEAVRGMFSLVDTQLGRVRALVNNAGTAGPSRRRVEEMTAQGVNALLAVNVTGSIICAREAVLRMSTKRGGYGGAIVNVSSASARLGAPNTWVDYAASKGAIDSFTIGLALEVASEGIRVNAVRPGLIDTDIHARSGMPDRVARTGKHMPMGRAGTPAEVAEAILWLASDAASYVSGAVLDVAGAK